MWDMTYAESELPDDEETEEEVEFVTRMLKLRKGSYILDLCCGQGRHSVRLAEKGFFVVGLDYSEELLKLAVKHNSKSNLWFVKGDMRNIPFQTNMFDAVINLFTSFGFFSDDENLQVLKSVASVLKPKGKLILDYWNPYVVVQLDSTRNWWWIDDNLLSLAEVRYDFALGKLHDIRTIINIRDGSIKEAMRNLRFYTLPEIDKMLEQVGMHITRVYGDVDEREYDGETRRLITLSEKIV